MGYLTPGVKAVGKDDKTPRSHARAHDAPALDQEAAVRLEQGHTRGRRSHGGRAQGRQRSRPELNTGEEIVEPQPGGGREATGLGALGGGRRQGRETGRGGGGRRAIGHPAGAGLIIAAAAFLGRLGRQTGWLHLREGGANDSDQEPDKAFHGVGSEEKGYGWEPASQPDIPSPPARATAWTRNARAGAPRPLLKLSLRQVRTKPSPLADAKRPRPVQASCSWRW